jgi:protein-disulfide isomerase
VIFSHRHRLLFRLLKVRIYRLTPSQNTKKQEIPMRRALLVTASVFTLIASSAFAQQPVATMTKEQVQTIVKEYLTSNPEVVVDALNAYQEKKAREASEKTKKTLKEKKAELFDNPALPAVGAKDADVQIVQFFDYHCGYCKHMLPVITELLDTDKKIRVVFHELPILSEDSTLASKAALAVNSIKPEKYFDFHRALMNTKGQYTEKGLAAEAKKLGIAEKDFKAALANPEIQKQLDTNQALAKELGISGTPAFVIGDEFIPGAGSLESFKKIIEEQRKGGKVPEPAKAAAPVGTPAPNPAAAPAAPTAAPVVPPAAPVSPAGAPAMPTPAPAAR